MTFKENEFILSVTQGVAGSPEASGPSGPPVRSSPSRNWRVFVFLSVQHAYNKIASRGFPRSLGAVRTASKIKPFKKLEAFCFKSVQHTYNKIVFLLFLIFILYQVGLTTSELFKKLEKVTPDVIILEMDIPEINGIATIKRLKQEYPNVRVLIFSGQSEDVYAMSTIRAGAYGYLSKTSEFDHIISAVKKVGDGSMFITNELAQRLVFDQGSQKPRRLFRKLSARR